MICAFSLQSLQWPALKQTGKLMDRHAILITVANFFLCCLFTGQWLQAQREGRPPNIVLIMADDLGYAHLGSYGQEKIRTPSLDRLASEGMKFTQAYSGDAVCAPARSVLMTGLHNGHTVIRSNGSGMFLSPEDVTMAEILKKAGYVTGGFGKWGLGDSGTTGHPLLQGFDDFFGQLHQIHAHFYYPFWVWNNGQPFFFQENLGERQARYVQDEIHARALQFIRDHYDRPFFAYLPYILPHVELAVPEEAEAPYRTRFPAVKLEDRREGYLGSDHAYATYAGMISHLDAQVGEVMSLLEELGIDQNTLLIFTSDNGPQGGHWDPLLTFFNAAGPFRGSKGDLYEGGIRVPLIARWPGQIEAGTTSDHVTYFPDFLPTFAEVAGVELSIQTDGVSFLPELLGKRQVEHKYLYWGHYRSRATKPHSQAVRAGPWKAIQPAAGAPVELYNLDDDPGEATDLAARYPERVAQMRGLMSEALGPGREFSEVTPPVRNDFVR